MEELVAKQTKEVFELVCQTFDDRGLKYERNDEEMFVICRGRGDDLPIDIGVFVNPRARVISLLSPLPINIAEDKRIEVALAVCTANHGLVNGSFDYNIGTGAISFRAVNSYLDTVPGKSLIDYLISIVIRTVDDYNDKFLAVSTGMMTVEQFIEWEDKMFNG